MQINSWSLRKVVRDSNNLFVTWLDCQLQFSSTFFFRLFTSSFLNNIFSAFAPTSTLTSSTQSSAAHQPCYRHDHLLSTKVSTTGSMWRGKFSPGLLEETSQLEMPFLCTSVYCLFSSKVHNCAVAPEHLRSETSFSHTCSIPNLNIVCK